MYLCTETTNLKSVAETYLQSGDKSEFDLLILLFTVGEFSSAKK